MNIKNARVIVTGGAGFIGSHLVDQLIENKNEVIVIDDFSSGSTLNLAHHGNSTQLYVEEADIRDESAMMRLIKGANFVFHLATRNVRLSLRRPTEVHEVNTTGTLNLLKASAAAGVKRFLYCSSSEVNGTADRVPMPEDYYYRPETIYGASKLAGEYYTLVFYRSRWLHTAVARPHNNYGPREHYAGVKGEVIPRLILSALARRPLTIFGDGSQTRDFTYVTETAGCLISLMEQDSVLGNVVNVCRGEEVSIKELALLIQELTGTDGDLEFRPGRPSDVMRLCGDSSFLRRLLGRSPQISIREGLIRTIAWFRQNVSIDDRLIKDLDSANWETSESEPWQDCMSSTQEEGGTR